MAPTLCITTWRSSMSSRSRDMRLGLSGLRCWLEKRPYQKEAERQRRLRRPRRTGAAPAAGAAPVRRGRRSRRCRSASFWYGLFSSQHLSPESPRRMSLLRLDIDDRQVVMHSVGAMCASTQELVESASFARVLDLYIDHLESHNPAALVELGLPERAAVLDLIRLLANNPLERVARTWAGPGDLLAGRGRLHEFVEGLYDFWRRWDRFLVVRATRSSGLFASKRMRSSTAARSGSPSSTSAAGLWLSRWSM